MNANRQKLIDALRAPMPEGFVWDYSNNENCALALALHLGITTSPGSGRTAVALDLTREQADNIFFYVGYREGRAMNSVTPFDIANALETTPA